MSLPHQPSQWPLPPTSIEMPPSAAIPPPTSAARTTASNKERKPKLRASCDMCAASKVKCSKEHPICARCLINGSPCIYGVSRKHGKPGRTRKKNPDGTPFVKASKQRPSPDGSEFGKFRIQPEESLNTPPPLTQYTSDFDWSSAWSPTTASLPTTPGFDFDMTSDPFYTAGGIDDLAFMDDIFFPTTQLESEPIQAIEPELTFRDPFAKRPSVQLNLPDLQALRDFVGGDMVNPMEYTFFSNNDIAMGNTDITNPFASTIPSAPSTPQSPMSNPIDSTHASSAAYDSMRIDIPLPTSQCCYPLALSTLESLRIVSSNTSSPSSSPTPSPLEYKSLDSVLRTTKAAIQSVTHLLSCRCSSSPHLAMLYSSITANILRWYQIAAGTSPNSSSSTSTSSSPSQSSSSTSSPHSTPSSSPLPSPFADPAENIFGIHMQPLRFGAYLFDEDEQEKLRRRVVRRELKGVRGLVEGIARWSATGAVKDGDERRGNAAEGEQAEFLYDVLGAWLKSELWRLEGEVSGV